MVAETTTARSLRAAICGDDTAYADVTALLAAAGVNAELSRWEAGSPPAPSSRDVLIFVADPLAAPASSPAVAGETIPVLKVCSPNAAQPQHATDLPEGWLRWSRLPAALARLSEPAPSRIAALRAREARRAAAFAASGPALLAARGVGEVAAGLCALAAAVLDADGCALYSAIQPTAAWTLLHRRGSVPSDAALPSGAELSPASDCEAIVLRGSAAAAFGAATIALAPLRCDDRRFLQVFAWASPDAADRGTLRSLRRVVQLGALTLAHAHHITDLESANRLKAEFVATVSHELRTPLNAILGYTDLLLDGEFGALGEEHCQVLRRAESSAAGLLELINSTLDVMRFDVADARIETVEVRYADLAEEVTRDVSSARHRRPVQIVHRDSRDLVLLTDPARLRLLLRQLLHAALATSQTHELELRASTTRHGAVVEIADAELFDAERGAPVLLDLETPPAHLAGPRLDTARRLAEILDGTITLWSTDDRRVVFRLTLPIAGAT